MASVTIETSKSPIREHLDHFFRSTVRLKSQELLLIAFSGGADSTALLAGLAERASHLRVRLHAVHVDHRLDPGSGDRAKRALALAKKLGIPSTLECISAPYNPAESLEAAARQRRYEILDRVADRYGARYVATAHHADDQAETVILRLLYGTGLEGLAGISPVHGRFLRPLLSVDRQQILSYVEECGLSWIQDPTNFETRTPRNAVRHFLLPKLQGEVGRESLCRLSMKARKARRRIRQWLTDHLEPRIIAGFPGAEIELQRLLNLPVELRTHALALLHRHAGSGYPPRLAAQAELWRQLRRRGGAVGCDCGDGWRWEVSGSRLLLLPEQPATPDFAYTVEMPGQVEVPELDLRVVLKFEDLESWMFRRHSDRAGLAVAITEGQAGVVRNRRPGDRFQALGRQRPSKLKDLFSRWRIPRPLRPRIPLLVIDGAIAWVPGVAISECFRVRADSPSILFARIETDQSAAVKRNTTTEKPS